MSTSFVHQSLLENPLLLRLIHHFSTRSARHIHRSRWKEGMTENVLDLVERSPSSQIRYTRWINKQYGIGDEPVWNDDPIQILVLLLPHQLELLQRYCGIAMLTQEITRTIDRKKQFEIREILGEELYQFALKRAGFLIRNLSDKLAVERSDLIGFNENVNQTGLKCIAASLADIESSLQKRVVLKFPERDSLPESTKVWIEHREQIWSFVKRVLVTEIAPELKPCFN